MRKQSLVLPGLIVALLLAMLPAHAAPGRPWAGVKSWAMQVESPDPQALAASPFDLLVVDYSTDGTDAGRLSPAQVEALKRRPDGGRRMVLAWLPVGIAARHRFYWQPEFQPGSPPWVGDEVPDWDGLYRVRFWDPEWQALLYGSPDAWLDQIVAAGFDGVLVDPSDSEAWYTEQGWTSAPSDLTDLVRSLAEHARRGAGGPDFGVFLQNADELVNDPLLLRVVTGVVEQGTWFGSAEAGTPTPQEETEGRESLLRVARLAGVMALNLDYTEDPAQIRAAHQKARPLGILEYAAPAALDRLVVVPGAQP